MASKKRAVSVVWYYKVPGKTSWSRVPVTFSPVGNKAQHPFADCNGRYQVRVYENGKPLYSNPPAKYQTADKIYSGLYYMSAAIAGQGSDVVRAGRPTKAEAMTIMHAFTLLSEARKNDIRSRSIKVAVDAFVNHSGLVYLSDITGDHVTAFYKQQCSVNAESTARQAWKRLRTFYAAAISGDITKYVEGNFSERANQRGDFYKEANVKTEAIFGSAPLVRNGAVTYYRKAEIASMRKALADNGDARLSLAFEVFLQCGLRARECEFLLWSTIDHVEKSISVVNHDEFTTKTGHRKNDNSTRTIPLSDALYIALMEHKKTPACTSSKYVFGCGDESRNGFLDSFRAIFKAAEVKVWNWNVTSDGADGITLRKFRRTCGCNLLWAGYDLLTVAAIMGHGKNVQTTIDEYVTLNPDGYRTKLNSIW